ncbi:Ferredoxin [Aphelenchoides besseyi]|nr:Ferredoxin [Aphelenchoides besseyi]
MCPKSPKGSSTDTKMEIGNFDENTLVFYVNGKRIEDKNVDQRTTLAAYLRDRLKLTGTKIGCNEGGCGACTVMISDVDPLSENIRHYSANSCLTPVCMVFGKAVTTVEGIGSTMSGRLHPVQERLSKAHGSQCGFCTPGFIMSMYSLLRNKPKPTTNDVDEALQGNLCRCTGYRPILGKRLSHLLLKPRYLEAYYSFAVEEDGTIRAPNDSKQTNGFCSMGENCCKNQKNKTDESRIEKRKLTQFADCAPYDSTQELIFPPELKHLSYHRKSFAMQSDKGFWFAPTSLDQLLRLKRRHPKARFISGNSELAVELKFRFIDLPIAINPKQIPELRNCYIDKDKKAVYVGMGLSLSEMKDRLNEFINELPEHQTAVMRSVCAMLHYFAGRHVRNMASVAGNIATASPISDLNPIWMASAAELLLDSEERGERRVKIDEKFFIAYRRTTIVSDEILKGLWIPFSQRGQFFRAYKQAQRREDDIAIVTGAFFAEIDVDHKVLDLRFAFGGMAPTTKLSVDAIEETRGRKWDEDLLRDVTDRLSREFALPAGVPGGMAKYRCSLVMSFFFKFFVHCCEQLKIPGYTSNGVESRVGEPQLSAFNSTQIYQDVPADQPKSDPVGRPLMHHSGEKHTTGEAIYSCDLKFPDCLHFAYVTSPVANGPINDIDTTEALQINGVVGYIDWRDVPGSLEIGHWGQVVFAKDRVSYFGQPIGGIVAEDHETARRAAARVKVDITRENPIITMDDAIANESFHMNQFVVHSQTGENNNNQWHPTDWSSYKRKVQGQLRIGGQEHFYLETNNCIVVPIECDEFDVISSTQSVADVQVEVSHALGIPRHKINVKVKRIGGGFGGKESSCGVIAAAVATAAQKYRRPVSCYVERFDDMAITGTRHPFLFDYKLAIDDDGRFLDFEVYSYNNAGFLIELSKGVLERCMVHLDNVYKWKNCDFMGRICKTNCASNTAFRGFGGPQAMFATESAIQHVAEEFDLDINKIRELNLYNEGDCTPFGMHLNQCNIRRCWTECMELSEFENRKKSVDEFNDKHKYRKRGIHVTPTKFGIGFGFKQLNQAGALVHIYTDGSVLISHAGMEMGQGLHTKILQIAARCLEVDISLIHIQETNTDKVPNTSPTAASVSSDLNGLAVKDACDKLMERIRPFKQENPNGKWIDWIIRAYQERVSLSQTGFAIIHNETIDFMNGKGAECFGYCVYGVGCSEVEIDCLTGDHHVLRTDIVMDVGDSLNPAIDIGQIEGAFTQGYGLFTMEEIKLKPDGMRLTRGPGNYKIPCADDAPRHFNVKLLKGSSNNRAIFSSKAVGEPPLFLGFSVFGAIRDAIRAYRKQNGFTGYFRLDSPASPERIRLACEDGILKKIPDPDINTKFTPWTVEFTITRL